MFKDLTQEDILQAIKSLQSKELMNTDYSVWFRGKLISPSAIISKAYVIKNAPRKRKSFNTDEAQKRLLELGFPIVGAKNKEKKGLFTEKELHTFIKLIARSHYDKNNQVDRNVGFFLNQVIWKQTNEWANELKIKGWKIKGRRSWNEQRHNKTGQGYKQYTWYRIYPENFINELIYFTIGVHGDGSLVIKMDIERSNKFFTSKKLDFFDKRRKELGILWHQIPKEKAQTYSLEMLVNETLNYFNEYLEKYFDITYELWPDIRLMRLTWNTNNWEFPIKHNWKKKDQGRNDVAYENQYGYGHEEWLFNPIFRMDGFQYGYIRGIQQMSNNVVFLNKIHLFTIDDKTKDRYLIGKINNVEIIADYEDQIEKVRPVYNKYLNQMVQELKDIKADYSYFLKNKFEPNVKFKWEDAKIFREPLLINRLKGYQYNRFQPYKINNELCIIINNVAVKENILQFIPGKAKSSKSYIKKIKGGSSTVTRIHTNITNDLEKYILEINGYKNNEISIEKSRIGGSEIDVLIKENDQFIFFEVKTCNKALLNIREAIGQLIEYAFLDKNIKIKKLVIVGPAMMNSEEQKFFIRLQSLIKKPIEYWAYFFDKNEINEKFIINK